MIAANNKTAHRAYQRTDLIRRSVVSHHVAQVHDQIVAGSYIEASLQGFDVGVDVTEKEDAHNQRASVAVTGQRATWPGATSIRGGSSTTHSRILDAQRGS